MPRPLFDSEYIFGLHDAGGEQLMFDAGKPGWLVFTEAIGHDPNDFGGTDYSTYSNRNLGVICRINNGYYPDGTIPHSSQYANFAQRCANFVARTPGCKIWIIGNEMNYGLERPAVFARVLPSGVPTMSKASSQPAESSLAKVAQLAQTFWGSITGRGGQVANASVAPANASNVSANGAYSRNSSMRLDSLRANPSFTGTNAFVTAAADNAEVITPDLYARCYRLCRDAIHAIPGHANDQVLVGAVAPWNNQTAYTGNLNGDWVQYFTDILTLLGPTDCDGFTLHTYTHQANPDLITDETRMDPPFQNRHYQFRAYMDFMQAVPASMRQLPAYITETNEDVPWLEQNISWVQRAYGEIDWWNRQAGNQPIRALVLYRWPNIDQWGIVGKGAVIEDLRLALQNDYRWRAPAVSPTPFQQGDWVETQDVVNLRRSPGYVGKTANDILLAAPRQNRLLVLSSSASMTDGLTWWNVQTQGISPPITGWAAQTSPAGIPLLMITKDPTMPNPGNAGFAIGDQVRVLAAARLRRTPGLTNKPANDVITQVVADSILTITAGPTLADNLTWWRVKGATLEGWMAQVAPDGQVLLTGVSRAISSASFQAGDTVATLDVVRLRNTPGYVGKAASDVVANIALGAQGKVLDGPRNVDNLTWWQIETTTNGAVVRGWMAEIGLDGAILLQRVSTTPPPSAAFAAGDLVVTTDILRVRRSPGFSNKPADDVLGQFEPRFTLNIGDGPQNADNLAWWRVGGITLAAGEVTGWVAQTAPDGQVLVARAPKLPGTNIPDKASGNYLGAPFQGHFGIAQLWGENPQIYRSITYDNIPLKGHNGIDFLTPVGTPLLAVDAGVVTDAVLNDPTGFGNYIKMQHSWGESIYAHMDSLGVQQGQSLARGAILGRSGATGFVDGPHLHFAIRINPYSRTDGWGGFSDPLPYMNPTDVELPNYVRAIAPQGAVARNTTQAARPSLRNKPGYAPDRPGVRRP